VRLGSDGLRKLLLHPGKLFSGYDELQHGNRPTIMTGRLTASS
jgi:hypothetical protein